MDNSSWIAGEIVQEKHHATKLFKVFERKGRFYLKNCKGRAEYFLALSKRQSHFESVKDEYFYEKVD